MLRREHIHTSVLVGDNHVMTSSSLTFLRSVPDSQAKVYNDYTPKLTRIRTNALLSIAGMMPDILKFVDAAVGTLQDLQDRTNSAVTAIQHAVSSSDVQASETACAKVRWAIDNGIDVQDICLQLIEDNDAEGFIALRQLVPWAIRAKKIMGATTSVTKSAQSIRESIVVLEKQIMTPAQLAALAELNECNVSIEMVRTNFTRLFTFFDLQEQPGVATSGMYHRVEQLYRWQGLPNDTQPKGFISLSDDFAGQYAARPSITR